MRKMLVAGLLCLAACDGSDMEFFVGHSEGVLRDALGPPSVTSIAPDGTRVLTYRDDAQYAALPGSYPAGAVGTVPFCATSFMVIDGTVLDVSQFGDGCPQTEDAPI